ncbi:HmuY family protein [Nannocystis sp. ILAH1]|uniref:HmuY family protein n=1 Tax=Nannocystis sp. ILAH1 TaxID=2996789 RepID=UPI0022720C36|nr:HmuY family protein [Nannocystis sp. ILAH1]MCY0993291.1 HmuY family protein [Nannocystis sp. ILAH1]
MSFTTCPKIHLILFALLAACGDSGQGPTSDSDATTGNGTGTDATTGNDATAGNDATTGTAADPGTTDDPTTTAEPGTTDNPDEPPNACPLAEVPCIDAAIQDLSLHDDKVSDAEVTSAQDGADWVSRVDASAGGTMGAATNPWVYLRFTDAGLERVDLDDVAALESGAWDIAAKRYGIRVNSGSSGPSCVTVAAPAGDYADLDAAPPDAEFAPEDYYDDACLLQEDGSGLPGSPAYRMAGWWGYTGCVTTTGFPYALRLADGRTVKLTIEAYYEAGQDDCNDNGTMGTGPALMTWRWSFLP